MRRFVVLFLISATMFTAPGCSKPKQKSYKPPPGKEGVKKVSSVNLAEAILLPKPYQFKFTHDPFKPLYRELPLTDKTTAPIEPEIRLVGVLVMEGRSSVLLELPSSEVGIFKEGDKIDEYTIRKIEPKRVILEKADKTFVLEIGEEK